MNRGLLRLWALVTVLWLAGAGSIAVLESPPTQRRSIPLTEVERAACGAEAFLDSERRPDFSDSGTPSNAAPEPRFGQFGQLVTQADSSQLEPLCGKRVESTRDWKLPDWRALSFLLGLPVAVLGLGVTIAWAVRGFRDGFDRAREPSYKVNPEGAASLLASKPANSDVRSALWRKRLKWTLFALLCAAAGVAGTVAVYNVRNSYENCILRSMPGAPERAVPLIRESCRQIAR